MDYRAAARFRATKLSDLIAEEMLAGGEGFFKASKKAISAKTKAKFTGIKQKFDPLNIASALMGRSRLGTTIAGKMFGRSSEDITYFAGDKGEKARPIRKFRYKNPLISSIGSSDVTPTKRNDGLANIFGKIYNTLLKNSEQNKRLKEIENNFRKENAQEDERRHKELINTILKITGKKTEKVEKNKGGGIFDILKGLFDKLMQYVTPVISFFELLLKPLKWLFEFFGKIGKYALKALGSLLSGPKALLVFLGEELMALVRKMIPSLFSPKTPVETPGKKTPTRDPKTGRFVKAQDAAKAAKESKILKGAKNTLKFLKKIPGLSLIAAGAGLLFEVEDAIKQNESGKLSDNEMKKKITGAVGGALGGVGGAEIGGMIGGALGSVVPGVGTVIGGIAGGIGGFLLGEKEGREIAEKAFDYFSSSETEVKPKTQSATKVQQTPAKTPAKTSSSAPVSSGTSSGSSSPASSPATPTSSGSSSPTSSPATPTSSGSSSPTSSPATPTSSGSSSPTSSPATPTPSGSSAPADLQTAMSDVGQKLSSAGQSFAENIKSSDIPNKLSDVVSKTKENLNLQLEETTKALSSSPIVTNNTTNTGLPKKTNEGVPAVIASVRDKELENSLFDSLRRVSYI